MRLMAVKTPRRWTLLYAALALLALLSLQHWLREAAGHQLVSYDRFERALAEGHIDALVVGEQLLTGHLREPEGSTTHWVTVQIDPALAERLDRYGVPYARVVESSLWRDVLSWILPSLVFFGLWFFLIRRMLDRQGGSSLMPIGPGKARVSVTRETGVKFADVAGVDEAKQELVEVVEFLRDPQAWSRLGAHIPKGVLLVGPPGTGKTLLARAVAGEAGVAFFSMSGSEFVELFVGVGAARVRDLFEQARKQAPAIIFIDELDALGRARGSWGSLGGHDEKEQTLHQLLAEMDGFDPSSGVIILAATNRPEILDPALLRAGRFDRQVLVDKPDKRGRLEILQVHVRKVRLDPDLQLEAVAAITPGFSGADLANLVNEATLAATRRQAQAVDLNDFTVAVERIVAGLEKRHRLLQPQERRVVAHHEIGHVLVAMALPGSDPVHKVSIIPRGIGALGYTLQRPTEDRYLMSAEELRRRICVLLGGRAAEQLVIGSLSTGAADDLAKATQIARDMVLRHGMESGLGPVSYDAPVAPWLEVPGLVSQEPWMAEATRQRIDEAVQRILTESLDRATGLLKMYRPALERCAAALLEHETLDAAQLAALMPELRTS